MNIGRSENMRRIKAKNTTPEISVRKLLRSMGYSGYRLHRRDIPGTPDIAFIGRRKAIVINGCFWHGHNCKKGARTPKSNQNYWIPKIERNRKRDERNLDALRLQGWNVLVLWECELKNLDDVTTRLTEFMR